MWQSKAKNIWKALRKTVVTGDFENQLDTEEKKNIIRQSRLMPAEEQRKIRSISCHMSSAVSPTLKRSVTINNFIKNSKKSHYEIDKELTNLYQRIAVPYNLLSMYAKDILLATLRKKEKRKRFTEIVDEVRQQPISKMSQRGKHVNFLLSCRMGYDYRVTKYIKHNLVDINWTFVNGNGCLHECILGNNCKTFDELLKVQYLDFDYPNQYGWTPINIAVFMKNYYCVFQLIMRGSDPDFIMPHTKNLSVREMSHADSRLAVILEAAEHWRPSKNKPRKWIKEDYSLPLRNDSDIAGSSDFDFGKAENNENEQKQRKLKEKFGNVLNVIRKTMDERQIRSRKSAAVDPMDKMMSIKELFQLMVSEMNNGNTERIAPIMKRIAYLKRKLYSNDSDDLSIDEEDNLITMNSKIERNKSAEQMMLREEDVRSEDIMVDSSDDENVNGKQVESKWETAMQGVKSANGSHEKEESEELDGSRRVSFTWTKMRATDAFRRKKTPIIKKKGFPQRILTKKGFFKLCKAQN